MTYSINSRKLGKKVTFSQPASWYVYVDLNGKAGCLGEQICAGGVTNYGSTIGCNPEWNDFVYTCKRWWKQWLKENREYVR